MTAVDVIILAGGPRKASAASAVGRPVWSLPIASSFSILDGWLKVLGVGFERTPRLTRRRSVLLVSENPLARDSRMESGIEIKPETRSHRGTAGVVADELAAGDADEGSLVLLIQASSSPAVDLGSLLKQGECGLPESPSGIIGESSLGRFGGVALCRQSIFRDVPTVGFYDFKEQLLPSLASASASFGAACIADRARNIQTREGWLSIAADWAALYGSEDGPPEHLAGGPQGSGERCVVDPSARTEGATLVSSVVMDDAQIESGAVVARSIIGPGITVKAGSRVIDAVVGDPAAAVKALGGLSASCDARVES